MPEAAELRFPNQVTEGAVSRTPEATLRSEVLPSLWQILRERRITVDTASLCSVLLSKGSLHGEDSFSSKRNKLQLCILKAEEPLAPYVWLAACVGTISENVVTAVTSSGHLCVPGTLCTSLAFSEHPCPWSSQVPSMLPQPTQSHLLSGNLLPGPTLGRFVDRISQCASHYHTMYQLQLCFKCVDFITVKDLLPVGPGALEDHRTENQKSAAWYMVWHLWLCNLEEPNYTGCFGFSDLQKW